MYSQIHYGRRYVKTMNGSVSESLKTDKLRRDGVRPRRCFWSLYELHGVRYSLVSPRPTDYLSPRAPTTAARSERYGRQILVVGQELWQNRLALFRRRVYHRRIPCKDRPYKLGQCWVYHRRNPCLSSWTPGRPLGVCRLCRFLCRHRCLHAYARE